LPKRGDDFRRLTLPTPAEWAAWKQGHPREEQIAYLCQRLRIMNCYQYGQPSDVDLFDTQYREPTGLDDSAAYPLDRGETHVINPLIEMLGVEADEDAEIEGNPGMSLTIRDVSALAPFLREDWMILSVGYWRTHHPSRTLITTRELMEWVLREATGRDMLDAREWKKLSQDGIDEKVRAMVAWAEERKEWKDEELLIEFLQEQQTAGGSWYDVEVEASKLVELAEKRGFPFIAHWLTHEKTHDHQKSYILRLMRKLDATRAKSHAERFLHHEDPDLQIEAGRILVHAEEVERGAAAVGDALSRVSYANISDPGLTRAVKFLIAEDRPECWAALRRLFDGIGTITISNFDPIVACRALEERGDPVGLIYYRKLLDNRETGIPNMVGWGRQIAHMFSDRLIEGYAPKDAGAQTIKEQTGSETEERLQAVKGWLDARIAAVKVDPARD
jgi:hypothetical protein